MSHEDHQAGGPQYRLATGRLDTEQAWGSPPRMILSFLPQPNYILETSVLVTTERGVYWHLGGKARDAAKHPAVRRQPQQQRSIWPQMLMLPRRRGGRQHRGEGGGGTASAMVKVTVRSRNHEAKCSLLLATMETPAQISKEQHFSFGNLG